MDSMLYKAIVRNDAQAFAYLVYQNEGILEQRTRNALNTVLHLASKFGHVELVMEIIKSKPGMVEAENKNIETPLHEACRQGDPRIVMLLLKTNPWVACKFNCDDQSALFVACSNGHLDVVQILLSQPWLLGLEDDVDLTSLHVAASKGHTDIAGKILSNCPHLASKMDKNGYNPLHHACSKGHLAITKMLLKHDLDLSVQFSKNGYTPLHLAAINGDAATLKEFLVMAPTSFHCLTSDEETVSHLAVRFNKNPAFVWLSDVFSDTNLFLQPDRFGNTILHIAVSCGHHHLAEHIINDRKVDMNQQNGRGHTALDILNHAENSSEIQNLKDLLKNAGGKTGTGFPQSPTHQRYTSELGRQVNSLLAYGSCSSIRELPPDNATGINQDGWMPTPITRGNSREESPQLHGSENSTIEENNLPKTPEFSAKRKKRAPVNMDPHTHRSQMRRNELIKLYETRYTRQGEVHREALQNARNTIILVAILIATVTFTAGINPPGGVHQEGPLIGKSTVGRTTAFKIFVISNNLALFISLCIVILLVSIIPFRRKPLMRLLVVAHKVLWVALSFMATAYVAATWVIMPHGKKKTWTFEAIISICASCLGAVFVYLGVELVRHWLRKLKWKKEVVTEKDRADDHKNGENQSVSVNSDMHSSRLFGYHTY